VTVSVEVKAGLPEGTVNMAVAPLGSPATLKVTTLSKPPTGFTAMLKLTFSPCFAEAAVGDTDMLKSAGSFTTTLPVAVLDRPPPKAVIVKVELPVEESGDASIFKVEENVGVPDCGEKV